MNFQNFKLNIELLAKKNENNFRDIQALITKYFRHIGTFIFDCQNMFVVRCSKNDPEEVFTHVKRCSYNPIYKNIPLQRCNYPEQPVFYCSMFSDTKKAFTSMTCIMETAFEQMKDHKIPRSHYTLSRWELQKPLKLWVLPFSRLSHRGNNDFKLMSEMMHSALENHERKNELLHVFTYVSNVFCKRRNKKTYYKISSAFYNYLLFSQKISGEFCDGLDYPSANTDGEGMNVVLKKDLVDNKLIFCSSAAMYLLKRNPKNPKDLSVLPCSDTAFSDLLGNLSFNIWTDDLRNYNT